MQPLVSILMPTYKQAHFLARALDSLLAQTFQAWEALIVDDHSPDDTERVVLSYMTDPRIRYQKLDQNRGLGAALNYALANTTAPLIAYLPSDDVYYAEHLTSLAETLNQNPYTVLAYTGVRYNYNRQSAGQIEGYPLQLVQVMHRRQADDYWMERAELVTDDLERMYWSKLRAYGEFTPTGQLTCEWVAHPHQRHKIIQEPVGGINPYKIYYGVQEPLRFHTTVGNYINEVDRYQPMRERPATPSTADSLKILLVGELAYNADRVLALEERGHKLYGLWMDEPYWYNAVGPLAFGHVEDLPRDNWQAALHQLKPDVIYGLLNWQAVPFAHQVMQAKGDIPFVWHFKEGPFICLEKGSWQQLIELYTGSDAQIYSSPEMQDWFMTVVPALRQQGLALNLDGDLPKRDWFQADRSPRLSAQTGEWHTVVPGRPIGLHPHTVGELADQNIHLHFYGDFTQGQWLSWIEKARQLGPRHLHLHSQVDQERWVTEFSQYDAGWLHFFKSENQGEIRRANWDDLNYPARLATLAVAGLPVLQRDNQGAIVATQTLVKDLDIGLFFTDMADLRQQLDDTTRLAQLQANTWRKRELFTFDYHTDQLIAFFRQVIAAAKSPGK